MAADHMSDKEREDLSDSVEEIREDYCSWARAVGFTADVREAEAFAEEEADLRQNAVYRKIDGRDLREYKWPHYCVLVHFPAEDEYEWDGFARYCSACGDGECVQEFMTWATQAYKTVVEHNEECHPPLRTKAARI